MRNEKLWWRGLAFAAVLLLTAGGAAFGQVQSGNLFGTAVDTGGETLPGVQITVGGIGADRVQFTDDQGQFRFLGLDPGRYDLTARLEGLSTVEYPGIDIRVGRNTTIEVVLAPAVEDVITVTAESPLLDERRISHGTTVSQVELEKIPTARDPWSLLTQTPGVLTDRVNVGGDQSGQQSIFVNPAVSTDENTFAIDGVVITDMAAIGASPTYFDFDQYTEMQFSTGGSDVTQITGGVTANLVTKRGTNAPRGSARFFLTDAEGFIDASKPDIAGELAPGQPPLQGVRVDEVLDFGVELGGPIVRDRLWVWGSYGRNDIKQISSQDLRDDTILENSALKFNAQLTPPNSLVGSWNRGDKIKDGRQPDSNVTPAATWDQSGPVEIWKLEDTHIFSSSFFLTGTYSFVDGGFGLVAKGGGLGADKPAPFLDRDGLWKDNFLTGISVRDMENFQVDGSYFFNTGAGNIGHELKFGASYREFEVESTFGWGGPHQGFTIHCVELGTCGLGELFGLGPGTDAHFGTAERFGTDIQVQEYTSAWVQDTITTGRWTFNLGLRWDLQDGRNLATTAPANPAFPALMPALTFGGNDGGGWDWNTISPRLGATYALGDARRTLLRASLARFAEQLSTADIIRVSPTAVANADFFFHSNDGRFNPAADPFTFIDFGGFDPDDPLSLSTPNVTDRGLKPELTDELVLGIEHALLPEFVVGVNLIGRRVTDIKEQQRLVNDGGTVRPAVLSDYVPDQVLTGVLPNGRPYGVQTFALRDGIANTGGFFLTNGDREREYLGASLVLTKRLANRWMARGHVQYGKPEWKSVPANFLHTATTSDGPNPDPLGGDIDGGIFVEQSAGSGPFADVLIQSNWSANVNGLYQVAPDRPWGFNVAGNVFFRQGYPLPWVRNNVVGADGISRNIRVSDRLDETRADDLTVVDLRIEKDLHLADNLGATLSLDGFNVFNDNSVLQRNRNLSSPQGNFLTQTLAPRIFRLGIRLSIR